MGPHPPNRWMGFPPPCQWVPRGSEDFPTQWLLMVLLTPTCHYLLIQCYKQQKTFWAKAHFCVSTKMMQRRHNLWFSVNCKCSGSSRSFCQIATSVYRYSSGQLHSSRWTGETFPREDLNKCVCVNIGTLTFCRGKIWQIWLCVCVDPLPCFGPESWNCSQPEWWFFEAQPP